MSLYPMNFGFQQPVQPQMPYGQQQMRAPSYFVQFMPQPNEIPELQRWFYSVDRDRSGQIGFEELARALSAQNPNEPVPVSTAKMCIRMFDQDMSGEIGFNEFCMLHKFIMNAQRAFFNVDQMRTGFIAAQQIPVAMQMAGLALPPHLTRMVMWNFDSHKQGMLKLNHFMELCATLALVRVQFESKDKQNSGSVTLTYEQYLSLAVALKT